MKSNNANRLSLKVWGDLACFTRPEMKVERVSYDVITPSAARGILEAILWKPEMRWNIREIEVLKPIQWVNIRRNEVGKKIPMAGKTGVMSAMKTGKGTLGLFIETERQQRASLLLKKVAYIIHAEIELTAKAQQGETTLKYQYMFKRRVKKGQCFHPPYFGCREFSANFADIDGSEKTLSEDRELGWMLYDLDYSGKEPIAQFFKARMCNGKIQIPDRKSLEVVR